MNPAKSLRIDILLLFVFCAFSSIITASAAEPPSWADARLPVRSGLFLWLDASRQDAARTALGLPRVPDGKPSGLWLDASGNSLHMAQRNTAAQPIWLNSTSGAAFRFDGKDDLFERTGLGRSLDQFTVFIVAAPRTNAGYFRGLLAVNASDRRDYDTGFTIDLGPFGTNRFENLSIEGIGFGGAIDMMTASLPFRNFQTLETHGGLGKNGIRLFINSRPQNSRDRQNSRIRVDDITVGARFYSNDQRPGFTQGNFDGDIAEVLVFDRDLNSTESGQVTTYLATKYSQIDVAFAERDSTLGAQLRRLDNPPAVQMFAPGFAAQEVALKLPNINNLRCRADGKVFAVAYSGDIYLLADQNNDGEFDRADTFWKNDGSLQTPIGVVLSPPGDPRGNGLYIAAKGKVVAILDTNGDDRADREITMAEGWPGIDGGHTVDALGIAVDAKGAVYFGLGAANFENAYRRDANGNAKYDLKSERGTIIKLAPDWRSREIIATGIRFSVSMAFNPDGDLFVTDQEGATWLPNGNPFDELLHIQTGRHYGFPPRHPKDLPNVIDEPSVFDYAPQHQSTCGLTFNVPVVKDGPIFGPETWRNDAIVCGYSRGKLYRTKLVKTPAGYVAANDLIGSLNMLTVDSCITRDGSLLVATHSGMPDWGVGPQGEGKLYRIRYVNKDEPQAVAAWLESPSELCVAFDHPLPTERLAELAKKTLITRGTSVAAGDRFEALRPGYDVVAAQEASARFPVRIQSSSVTPDRRTLIFVIDAHTERMPYAITLPGNKTKPESDTLAQVNEIDLAVETSGVSASWKSADGRDQWNGWLPHINLAVSRVLTRGSASHEELWRRLEQPGKLILTTNLDLTNMLRPAVQPGSKLDYTLPTETITLRFESTSDLQILEHHESSQEKTPKGAKLVFNGPKSPLHAISLEVATGRPNVDVSFSWHTGEDARERALPLRRFVMPWAHIGSAADQLVTRTRNPALEGGNWLRGRTQFYGEPANCARCHTVRGEGGQIGPDLSNLTHRDYTSVLRDIREPSAALNPDYLTQLVALNDGRVLEGTVKSEGTRLVVADREGKLTTVERSNVESTKPAAMSIMPEKLVDLLGPERLKDLLTFLLIPAIDPAPIHRDDAPPPRSRKDVQAILDASRSNASEKPKPLKIVLVDGPKDHGIDEHDYPAWSERWSSLLALADGVTVVKRSAWPTADDLATANVLVWFSANPGFTAERAKELDTFLARGGGMVYLHFAVNGRNAPEALAERIGLAWRDGASKFRHGPVKFVINPANPHPITSGFTSIDFVDESYWNLAGDLAKVKTLATSLEEGQPRPMLWTREHTKGRAVGCLLGHYTWTFDDPYFRILILRSIAWSAGDDPNRLLPLATVGAR